MRQRIITEIDIYLQSLTEEDRINAINAFRQAIHKNSPFREQPIDCVLWVKQDAITANDYNPITLPHRKNDYSASHWNLMDSPSLSL